MLKDQVGFSLIKQIVNTTLHTLYAHDQLLLDYPDPRSTAGERSIVFRFGWYMLETLKNIPTLEWADLDCEYNRNQYHSKELVYQRTGNSSAASHRVIPDLILHQRRSNDNNLLVIEFKKRYASRYTKSNDISKLCAFTDPEKTYKYSFGLYLELEPHRATVKVFRNGEHDTSLDFEFTP